jgi:hypothetical protein
MSVDPLWVRWPYARIRRELETDAGEVVRFVAQLEYDVQATPTGENDPEWRTVARFDHDRTGEMGHDISEAGLHLDIYRDEAKYRDLTGFPPVPLDRAFRYSETYLLRHADRLLEQFERWHDLHGPWRTQDSE